MKRQCGYRKKGGAYLTVPTSGDGAPIEYFLVDPPQPVDLETLGIVPRGVHLIEKEGVWHVFDVVGQDSYPNVADLVEEARYVITRWNILTSGCIHSPDSFGRHCWSLSEPEGSISGVINNRAGPARTLANSLPKSRKYLMANR